jgi:hypothetical protein
MARRDEDTMCYTKWKFYFIFFRLQNGKLNTKKNAHKLCFNVTFLKKIFAPTRIGMQQKYNKFFFKLQWTQETSVL